MVEPSSDTRYHCPVPAGAPSWGIDLADLAVGSAARQRRRGESGRGLADRDWPSRRRRRNALRRARSRAALRQPELHGPAVRDAVAGRG